MRMILQMILLSSCALSWCVERPREHASIPMLLLTRYHIVEPFIELDTAKRIKVTQTARELMALDLRSSSTLEKLLSDAYIKFCNIIEISSPKIEIISKSMTHPRMRMTFPDLTAQLRPLRKDIDRGLADLVASDRLTAEQQSILLFQSERLLNQWFFGFGSRLETIMIGIGKNLENPKVIEWDYAFEYRRENSSGSLSSGGSDLPVEYHVFFQFSALPFGELAENGPRGR